MTQVEYDDAMEELEERLKEYLKEYKDVFYYYEGLKDVVKSTSIHPAGIIAGNYNLHEMLGVKYDKNKLHYVTSCDMKAVDSCNYVKYDILGLNTIDRILNASRISGTKFMFDKIDDCDAKVYEALFKSPIGLFQFESQTAFSALKKFNPVSVEEIALVSAALRPGCASFREKLLAREFNNNPDERIDKLLQDTYGYMLFQEQQISFLQQLCGFTPGQADIVRRCIKHDNVVWLHNGGHVKISDVNIGDVVWSMSSDMKLVNNKITDKFYNGNREIFRIATVEGYAIECTDDHPLFSEGEWRTLKDIKIGDCLYAIGEPDIERVYIKSIESIGVHECWDIEVENDHNFICEGLVVHNCIGKKDDVLLNLWLPKIRQGYVDNAIKSKDEAEKDIDQYIEVFVNAARYSFNKAHAIAYSIITYACGYVRYHKKEAFVASFLNSSRSDEDIINGTKLASILGIKIYPAKYGKSRASYVVEDGAIYKGVESIINLSALFAEELFDISNNYNYKTFPEIIDAIYLHSKAKNTTKIETLIRVNYFSDYGKRKKLYTYFMLYQTYGKSKTLNKEKINGAIKTVADECGFVQTEKQYKIDAKVLMNALWNKLKDQDFTAQEILIDELSFLNYIESDIPQKDKVGTVVWAGNTKRGRSVLLGNNWFNIADKCRLPQKGDVLLYDNIKNTIVNYELLELKRNKR